MAGEVVVGMLARRVPERRLPGAPIGHDVTTIPGPGAVVAVRYQSSPIGPFTELSVIEPVRRGPRLGMAVTLSVVDDERARRHGRANWGFPRELGSLRWSSVAGTIQLRWDEEELVLKADTRRIYAPLVVPLHLLQRRGPSPLIVPVSLRGLARWARIDIEVPAECPLGPLAGRHGGVVVSAQQVRIEPARGPLDWAHLLARLVGRVGSQELRPSA